MSDIEKIIKDKIDNSEIKWFKDPFPHAIIDDFLPSDLFLKISKKLTKIDDVQDLKKTFKSHVELNKRVYGDKDLDEDLRLPIEASIGNLRSSSRSLSPYTLLFNSTCDLKVFFKS